VWHGVGLNVAVDENFGFESGTVDNPLILFAFRSEFDVQILSVAFTISLAVGCDASVQASILPGDFLQS